jgi:hypothetical protein
LSPTRSTAARRDVGRRRTPGSRPPLLHAGDVGRCRRAHACASQAPPAWSPSAAPRVHLGDAGEVARRRSGCAYHGTQARSPAAAPRAPPRGSSEVAHQRSARASPEWRKMKPFWPAPAALPYSLFPNHRQHLREVAHPLTPSEQRMLPRHPV